MARPRRRRRAGPARRRAGAAGVAVPDRGRRWPASATARAARRSTTSAPAGRSSRSSTARRDEPWKTSLVTSPLIRHLRDPDRTVVCVHNTPGRAAVLACRSCRTLAAVRAVRGGGRRWPTTARCVCRRCGTVRPPVCRRCGASAFANLRPGVTRLREELEAAAGRPVVAVTGATTTAPPAGRRLRRHRGRAAPGAAGRRGRLPRLRRRAAGAALPRRRAGDGAARAGRPARRAAAGGGRVLVQTFLPRPRGPAGRAARRSRPAGRAGAARRRLLGLPPFGALAAVSGAGQRRVRRRPAGGAPASRVGGGAGRRDLVRAPTWDELGQALVATPRPKGSRLRVEVDPPRR